MKQIIVIVTLFSVLSMLVSREQADDKEQKKLVAIADKMILASNRLSSIQDDTSLAVIDEFVPLAQYVIEQLRKK